MHSLYSSRNEANSLSQQLRNKLMLSARGVLRDIAVANQTNSRDQLLIALGAAENYVATRNALAPTIALDGYTRNVQGHISKLKHKLNKMDTQ